MWAIVTTEPQGQFEPNFGGMVRQNCVRPVKMAAKLKIEKRGDEILIVVRNCVRPSVR